MRQCRQQYCTKEPVTTTDNSPKWRIIYRLPLIRLFAGFQRIKFYQAALTTVGTPIAFVFGSEQIATVCGYIGLTGLITLTLGSYAVKNLVGLVYINEQETTLKLAYVDFWGRRLDTSINVDDLLPEWEQARPSRLAFYQAICTRSNKDLRYKLLHRFGVVTDPDLFAGLFGE